ncbi:hypothetical protein HZI73_20720 [Vallitalea pronyensis]|uniref:Lipoprotein n=1 Tax=Vallitalea pronyensis TaxID=1348613 RepID=A0A8J8MN97_9FIRM|nr:hypothetical protein [Vallitalea pronyensis]QUI24576.1 hypothetical protein HZI73_20720 [Vallitalea pronyensis]
MKKVLHLTILSVMMLTIGCRHTMSTDRDKEKADTSEIQQHASGENKHEETTLSHEISEANADLDVISCLSDLGISDIRKATMDQVKALKIMPVADNAAEQILPTEVYDWEVDDGHYKLLLGIYKKTRFMLLYRESGQYADGLCWSIKTDDYPIATYRSKQNAFSVTSFCKDWGTGISLFVGQWFDVNKGKLIKYFEYPLYGYEGITTRRGYPKNYQVVDEGYDEKTGDFHVTYQLALDLDSMEQEMVGTKKTVVYRWDDVNKVFDYQHVDIHDVLKEVLLTDDVEDVILKENHEAIKRIVERLKEENEMDMGCIVAFLSKCSQSNERDHMLEILRERLVEKESAFSEDYLRMIENAL